MLEEIFFAWWIFLPVGLATLGAFFSSKIPYIRNLSYPVDFYKKIKGKRILGSHKTIRGFIVGILIAIITVYLQIFLYKQSAYLREIIFIDYNTIDPVFFGFLCGFGSLAGDAVKSFFKRQQGIRPGQSWFPYDQIDQILGGIVCTWFYLPLSIVDYFFIFLVWFLIHPFFTFLGYILRLKRYPL